MVWRVFHFSPGLLVPMFGLAAPLSICPFYGLTALGAVSLDDGVYCTQWDKVFAPQQIFSSILCSITRLSSAI